MGKAFVYIMKMLGHPVFFCAGDHGPARSRANAGILLVAFSIACPTRQGFTTDSQMSHLSHMTAYDIGNASGYPLKIIGQSAATEPS